MVTHRPTRYSISMSFPGRGHVYGVVNALSAHTSATTITGMRPKIVRYERAAAIWGNRNAALLSGVPHHADGVHVGQPAFKSLGYFHEMVLGLRAWEGGGTKSSRVGFWQGGGADNRSPSGVIAAGLGAHRWLTGISAPARSRCRPRHRAVIHRLAAGNGFEGLNLVPLKLYAIGLDSP